MDHNYGSGGSYIVFVLIAGRGRHDASEEWLKNICVIF
jgi:hypothetical protein